MSIAKAKAKTYHLKETALLPKARQIILKKLLEANASENKVHRIDSLVKTFQPLPKSNL
jgi:hypothetical protein